MSILIVDDSKEIREYLNVVLSKAGFRDLLFAKSAADAFTLLGMDGVSGEQNSIDLILMDCLMPSMNGIEACKSIKAKDNLKDIPVIMVTSLDEVWSLPMAFEAGVMDYIPKPIDKVELIVRVTSALKLKHETDRSNDALRKLEVANRKLQLLSSLDGLTGISNRRSFDEFIDREWRRGLREDRPTSLVMVDIDFFKKYNDGYGHQAGDDCLKRVAKILADEVSRPGDLVARYGGEEFVIVLGNTDKSVAADIAEGSRSKVEKAKIPHAYSDISDVVTLSIGVSTLVPDVKLSPGMLIEAADKALYKAKHEGRNMVRISGD